MITSIPLSALELGLGFQRYEEISRNIGRIGLIPKEARQRIIDMANEKLSNKTKTLGLALIKDMAYDKSVYQLAGLDYSEGPPEEEGLFITAVADYLLRDISDFFHKTL